MDNKRKSCWPLVAATFILSTIFVLAFKSHTDSIKRVHTTIHPQNNIPEPKHATSAEELLRVKASLSTCNDEKSTRLMNQKVVSFTLHFPSSLLNNRSVLSKTEKLYRARIRGNLERIRMYYKDYVMRIYTNFNVSQIPDGELCKLVCNNANIQWCNIEETPSYGNLSDLSPAFWRLLPLGDFYVDTFLSRDLNSIITKREAVAVEDWIQLNKSFHTLHDRYYEHTPSPVSGRLFGARNTLYRGKEFAKGLLDEMIVLSNDSKKNSSIHENVDDAVLDEVIYTKYKSELVVTDSYYCEYFGKDENSITRPFPIQRLNANDFIGNPLFGGGDWSDQPCPWACRPVYGKTWEFC